MGKAARNERRKLHAMFFNNLAVAVTIAGFFAPYFSLIVLPIEQRNGRLFLFEVAVALFLAGCLHYLAITFVSGTED